MAATDAPGLVVVMVDTEEVDEFRRQVNLAEELAYGDSNDDEIHALRDLAGAAEALLAQLAVDEETLLDFRESVDAVETMQSNDDEIDALWSVVRSAQDAVDEVVLRYVCECCDRTVSSDRARCGHCEYDRCYLLDR